MQFDPFVKLIKTEHSINIWRKKENPYKELDVLTKVGGNVCYVFIEYVEISNKKPEFEITLYCPQML